MWLDFSNEGIVNDDFAKSFVEKHRPPSISDLFIKITQLLNNSTSSVIYELNVSKNNVHAYTILKYCLDNEYGYFSSEEFYNLDLSNTIVFTEDIEKCVNLIYELLNKYKKLTINLLNTSLTHTEFTKLKTKYAFNEIDLENRLKISYIQDYSKPFVF
jgi:hypothetical protein